MTDDARSKILARRAKFVATAMVGLAASGCGKQTAARPDASSELSEAPDASGGSAPPDTTGGDNTAPPAPCLTTTAPSPPPPRPCLKVAPRPCLEPPNCDPPYTVDPKTGARRYRKECL